MKKQISRFYGVAHIKGGSGKTATAIQMAVLLAESGREVLFVDGDTKGTHATKLLRRRNEDRTEEQPEISYTQLRSKKHLLDLVERAETEGFDLVIDTNPTVSDVFVGVLTLCQVAIHPIRLGHVELDSFSSLIDLLGMIAPIRKANNMPKLRSRTLVTDFRPSKQGRNIRDYLDGLEEMKYLGEIPHSERFGEALVGGFALWEVAKHHQHIVQIREVIGGCIER